MQETINYPLNSIAYHTLPLNALVGPVADDMILTLFDGRQLFLGKDDLVQTLTHPEVQQPGLHLKSPTRVISLRGLVSHSRMFYLEVITLEEFVDITRDHVPGVVQEALPVSYTVKNSVYLQVVDVKDASDSHFVVDPVTIPTIVAPVFPSGCSCVLSSTPCGEKLAHLLFPPGTYN